MESRGINNMIPVTISASGRMIPLIHIVYDARARNGTWCCSPYENHPHGCPNFKKGCTGKRPDFGKVMLFYNWYAVIEEFDLKAHAEQMKARHAHWTERQCRNPLYWQGHVRSKLTRKAEYAAGQLNEYGHYLKNENIILDIPEACGINVFETMAQVGVTLERKPDTVRKVMIVGKKRIISLEQQQTNKEQARKQER